MNKNNIEQHRSQAMVQYHQLVQTILKNVINIIPEPAKVAFVVLDCREHHKMDIFYYQDKWVSGMQLEEVEKLLSQAPQIIQYITELFVNVEIAMYDFIQLRYDYQTHEWQSHFVWRDKPQQTSISLAQFVDKWQVRMDKDIQQW